jgi:hypothetical protein
LGVTLHAVEGRGPDDFDGAFARHRPGAPRRAGRLLRPPHPGALETDRGLRDPAPPADDLRNQGVCPGWWSHDLWGQPAGPHAPHRRSSAKVTL